MYLHCIMCVCRCFQWIMVTFMIQISPKLAKLYPIYVQLQYKLLYLFIFKNPWNTSEITHLILLKCIYNLMFMFVNTLNEFWLHLWLKYHQNCQIISIIRVLRVYKKNERDSSEITYIFFLKYIHSVRSLMF